MQQRKDLDTVLFDARNFTFPNDGYGIGIKDFVSRLE
jgi:hypothetical protein